MSTSAFGAFSLRKAPPISDDDFQKLRDFIYEQSGIDIPIKRKYLLENRLGARLQDLNLKSFKEYYEYLRFSPGRDKELEKLFEQVTTNETSFFRDIKQLEVFQKHVLAEIIEKQDKGGSKELNIWSAGCSSGEEPYTLGIMLHEVLRMSIIGWKIRITANDLSPAVLEKAQKGVYGEYAFKTTPKEIIAKYFVSDAGGLKIHPKVQKLVSFSRINLNDQLAVKRVPRSQIIFCRNVIIYFDDEMKKKVLKTFYDNLVPGGYLILGHSESIHNLTKAFTPIIRPGGIAYKKQG